jgi:hypothetical protein
MQGTRTSRFSRFALSADGTSAFPAIADGLPELVQCLSIDFTEVSFERLGVISWIESLLRSGDPRIHTKNHEKQKPGFFDPQNWGSYFPVV